MKLSEIINIEYQLYRDAQSDPAEVRERDRRIGRDYSGSENDRRSIFRYWLNRLEGETPYPGKALSSGLTFLRYSVFFFFLISGAMTCAGLLAYDGSRPVNIINFLAVFVGFQVLLYLLFFLNILTGAFLGKIPFVGDFYRFAEFIFGLIIQKVSGRLFNNKTESIRRIRNIVHRAESRHNIYKTLERWTLFSVTQLGGFAFSLGALFTCAYLITFSDLAFAWNTTLDIPPGSFHKIVDFISTPWSMFLRDCVPPLELVESTRFFRLNGEYSGVHSSALIAGGWWPFLICALLFYGLIPRLIFLILARFVLYRAQARAPFLSAEFDSLYRRLTSPIYSSQAGFGQKGEKRHDKSLMRDVNELSLNAESCYLILWGELDLSEEKIQKIIQSRFQWNIMETFHAGTLENDQDESTLKKFEGSAAGDPVILIAESWEAPSKAVMHFLERLRSNISEKRTIVIGLINQDAGNKLIPPGLSDWHNWQDAAVKLNDPFVCVEPVTEAA